MIQNILKPVYHLLLIVHHLDCKSKTEPHSARHFYPLWCNKNYAILTMTKWNLDKLNLASFPFDQNSCLHVTKKISFGERNSIFLVFLTKKFRSTRFPYQNSLQFLVELEWFTFKKFNNFGSFLETFQEISTWLITPVSSSRMFGWIESSLPSFTG